MGLFFSIFSYNIIYEVLEKIKGIYFLQWER